MTAHHGFTTDDNRDGAGDEDLRREGDRIAHLIDDLAVVGGAPVRQRVEELVARLLHLYGSGLARLLVMLAAGSGDGGLDEATRARLRADPLLSSLLVLHGLHPDPDAAREFDPGPAPAPAAPAPAGGLVQIDLGRSRGAKSGGGWGP
jgi:hypothetical protein